MGSIRKKTITLGMCFIVIFSFAKRSDSFFWQKSKKSQDQKKFVYVRAFDLEEGFMQDDPIKIRTKEMLEDIFQQDENYYITRDEDISVFLEHEEKMMSLGECSTDACIKKLMEKINAEILIYGRIRKKNEFTYITARLMDRTSGMPKVSKIKTIKYRYANFYEKGIKALGTYLITGNESAVRKFMDSVYDREEQEEYERKRNEEREKEWKNIRDFEMKVKNAALERKHNITSKAPLIRFGSSIYHKTADKVLNKYFQNQKAFFIDWVILRKGEQSSIRSRSEFGEFTDSCKKSCTGSCSDSCTCLSPKLFTYGDVYLRGLYRIFKMNDSVIDPNGMIGEDVLTKSTAHMAAFDLGFRYKFQIYLMMTAFDFYILSGLRYQYYYEKAKDPLQEKKHLDVAFHSLGIYAGAGMEIAFFENLGFFMEYNIGITPVGDSDPRNVEGSQIYVGMTLRTSLY